MNGGSLNAGQRVRLINDPGRVGVLTGRTLARAGLTRWEVQFPDGPSYVPEDQLEILADVPEHPLELLRRGRLGLAADLRRTLTHVRVTGRLANIIYSMDMTGTDFYAYQFKPIVKLLNSPTAGLLIADEAGLGAAGGAGRPRACQAHLQLLELAQGEVTLIADLLSVLQVRDLLGSTNEVRLVDGVARRTARGADADLRWAAPS